MNIIVLLYLLDGPPDNNRQVGDVEIDTGPTYTYIYQTRLHVVSLYHDNYIIPLEIYLPIT